MNDREKIRRWAVEELERKGHGSKRNLAERLKVDASAIPRILKDQAGKERREITAIELIEMMRFFNSTPPVWPAGDEAGDDDPDTHIRRITEDELNEPPPEPDDVLTIGERTGHRGFPQDAIAQIDVTAGMGAGGMTIISDGVPGAAGMTFAAEHVRDYWRLPVDVLVGLGLRSTDITIMPVQGDSMSPTLTEGDYVFVDTRHRLPSPPGLYALTDDFGGVIVKRLEVERREEDDVIVREISDNPKHMARERRLSDMRIIGRVVRRFGIVG